jgi:ParB family transcriptional regulator, chromosome partitioning protein
MIQEELHQVEIHQIRVNPYQPRRHFAQEEMEELAQSIRSVGLIHPPLVRKVEGEEGYELISGERRYRAAQLAGLKSMPVIVKASAEVHSAQAALIENIQRVDLNAMEVARALRGLMNQFGYGQDELAQKVGKKRSTIANYLRLLGLPKEIQESVASGQITMGHAKAILALEGFEKQNLLHEIIVDEELTVRESEEAALRISEKAKRQALVPANRDFFLEQLAEKIQRMLGTKVTILGRGKRGKITIDYYNLDDLDRLLNLFGVE